MNEETLNNLKQFITATIRQEITGVHKDITNLETKIDARFDENDKRFDAIDARFDENNTIQNEILNAIGEAQESQNKAIRHQADVIDDHERRIFKLEKSTA